MSKKSEEWSARLSRRDSNESVTSFCRREGVSKASFYYWRRRVASRFIEVRVTPKTSLVVEVGGARIDVPTSFDGAHLRAVVDALL